MKELTSTRNSLSVPLILDIASGIHALHARHSSTRLGENVPIRIHVHLALHQGSSGIMANCVEQALRFNDLLLAGDGILHHKMAHELVVSAANFRRNSVEAHSDLFILEESRGHGLASAEDVPSHQDGDMAAVLGQEGGFFGGRVTSADHVERLVAEEGEGAVADCAGGDTVLPVGFFAGEVHATGGCAGGDDDGVGGVGFVGGELGAVFEGAGGEVEFCDGVGDDFGAKSFGLFAHVVLFSC